MNIRSIGLIALLASLSGFAASCYYYDYDHERRYSYDSRRWDDRYDRYYDRYYDRRYDWRGDRYRDWYYDNRYSLHRRDRDHYDD